MSARKVLVLGAGPAGLAVSACLARQNIDLDLVDRQGAPGGAYTRAYPRTQLASPARYNQLPGAPLDVSTEYINVETYARYLRAYAERHALRPQAGEVERIQPDGDGFRVRFAGSAGAIDYRYVVVASGMFDFPAWPSIPGLAAAPDVVHVAQWKGPPSVTERRLLIIGGATSAVEVAEECARAGIRSVVSVRGRAVNIWPQRVLGRDIHDFVRWFESLPRALMGAYCAGMQTLPATDRGFGRLRRAGWIEVSGPVKRVDERRVTFADGRSEQIAAIVCATGYRHDTPFLADEARATDACQSRAWPGLFLLGMPCARRLNSAFLRGISRDAEFIARQIADAHA